MQHVRQEDSCTCIVGKLEKWFAESRDRYHRKQTDYIFKCEEKNETITSNIVTVIMKWGTRRLGLNDNKVSAHSLRYAGATMLAAAAFIISSLGMAVGQRIQKLLNYMQP